MRRIATVVLGALAALMLAGAASAPARKTGLTLTTAAGPLTAGQAVLMSASAFTWKTPVTKLECSTAQLAGTLLSSSASKATVSFTSALAEGMQIEGACKSNNLGVALFASSGLPWTLELSKQGTATMKGTSKLVWTVSFISRPGEPKCALEAKRIQTSIPASGPLAITWTAQMFARAKKGNPSLCPAEGSLSASWQLSSGGEAIEATL